MDQVDEVKSKVDIVEVISSYLPLKRAGRNLAGLCPFHSEKTPSFMVSPERQAFKCFGCSVGGDVFTFLEKMEGWEFRETLEELAKRAGVKLKDFKPTGASREKEKLIEINKLAAKFYSYILKNHKLGEPGRQYLKKRGIPETLWEKFDLGYAPGGWENISQFLAKKGFGLADIAIAGLVIGRESKSGGGYYDRFRERLMFPIADSRGSVAGFSGRLLDEKTKEAPLRSPKASFEGQAKYINSPQTPIFNKGLLLFGLSLARQSIREKNEAVLVEGEFDVLSSVVAGVLNVVASKGTALTDGQVAILSRLAEKVILCFDTDLAGDAASRRGIELMDLRGLTVKVVELGDFGDPDEFAQKDPAGYRRAIAKAKEVYDYFIDSAQRRYDAGSAEGKKKIGREIVPVLSKITDDIVRAHYVSRLAKVLDLDTQFVADAVHSRKSDLVVSELPDAGAKVKVSREEYFLALLLNFDEILEDTFKMLSPLDFHEERARRFWTWLRDIIGSSKTRTFSALFRRLPKDLSEFVDGLYLVAVSPDFADRELWAAEVAKVAAIMKRVSLKRAISDISYKLGEAQDKHDERQIKILMGKFNKITEELAASDAKKSYQKT